MGRGKPRVGVNLYGKVSISVSYLFVETGVLSLGTGRCGGQRIGNVHRIRRGVARSAPREVLRPKGREKYLRIWPSWRDNLTQISRLKPKTSTELVLFTGYFH